MNIVQKLQSRLKLRQLQVVVAIDDFSNIRAAAEYLGVSQPAVSKYIKELETDFGFKLFERTNRGVIPNELGMALIRNARLILSQIKQTSEELSDIATGYGGRITVGVLTANVAPIVPSAIAQMLDKRPSTNFTIIEGSNDGLMPALIQGDLDVVVGRLPEFFNRKLIDQKKLYSEKNIFVVGASHPLLKKSAIKLADLTSWDWVLPNIQADVRRQIDSAFHELGLELPNSKVESVSRPSNRHLIEHTNMIGIFAESVIRDDIEAGNLVQLPTMLNLVSTDVGLSTKKVEKNSPILEIYINELCKRAVEYSESMN